MSTCMYFLRRCHKPAINDRDRSPQIVTVPSPRRTASASAACRPKTRMREITAYGKRGDPYVPSNSIAALGAVQVVRCDVTLGILSAR